MKYRTVEPDELLQSGDEWFDERFDSWEPTSREGEYPEDNVEYRRKVE